MVLPGHHIQKVSERLLLLQVSDLRRFLQEGTAGTQRLFLSSSKASAPQQPAREMSVTRWQVARAKFLEIFNTTVPIFCFWKLFDTLTVHE